MYEQAYLVACYMLGERYHSGQFSRGYRLLGQSQYRAAREYSAWDIGRTVEKLRLGQLYTKHGDFRRAVAYMLNQLRKYRHSL